MKTSSAAACSAFCKLQAIAEAYEEPAFSSLLSVADVPGSATHDKDTAALTAAAELWKSLALFDAKAIREVDAAFQEEDATLANQLRSMGLMF